MFLEGVTMTERVCRNCRWFDQLPEKGYGACKRHPPINLDGEHPYTDDENFCGEWSDASITPEQEEQRQFVRQIYLAMAASEWSASYSEDDMWKVAGKLAAAEPQIQKEEGE
jgi:hypothetical protein